jgi:hypothetical protein
MRIMHSMYNIKITYACYSRCNLTVVEWNNNCATKNLEAYNYKVSQTLFQSCD